MLWTLIIAMALGAPEPTNEGIGIVGTGGWGSGPPAAIRINLMPLNPAPKGPMDERLLIAMRRQLFIASVTDRSRALITLAAATPKNARVAKVHRAFVDAQWAITPGRHYLQGLRADKSGWRDTRTRAFEELLMAELEARNLVKQSVRNIQPLARLPKGPAFNVESCHEMGDYLHIRRSAPKDPVPLERPDSVDPGSRADIIVRLDPTGTSSLAASINADPDSPAVRACYASVAGQWGVPMMDEHYDGPEAGQPTTYCRFIRCAF